MESQHKEEQKRIQVLRLVEVIKLHQENIKQINTVKKKCEWIYGYRSNIQFATLISGGVKSINGGKH